MCHGAEAVKVENLYHSPSLRPQALNGITLTVKI